MTKAKGIPRRGREGLAEILAHEPPSIRLRGDGRDGFPLLAGCLKSEAPLPRVESPSVSAFRGQDVLNTRRSPPPPSLSYFQPSRCGEEDRGSRTRCPALMFLPLLKNIDERFSFLLLDSKHIFPICIYFHKGSIP